MQTIVVMNKVRLLVDYDYMPEDRSVGWGEEAEVLAVHVANGPEGREFDIRALLSPAQITALESACCKHAKDPSDDFDTDEPMYHWSMGRMAA